MDATLAELEFDNDVRVVVIAGAGGNFSAGQHLKEYFRALENDPDGRKRAQDTANRWRWERLYMYGKPTISMVQGYCARRRVHATDRHRFRAGGRGRGVLALGGELGNHPGALVARSSPTPCFAGTRSTTPASARTSTVSRPRGSASSTRPTRRTGSRGRPRSLR